MKDNKFTVGQKISWLTIINGKITKLIGEVTDVIGSYVKCKGVCEVSGREYTDTLMDYDTTVKMLEQ